MVNIWHQYQCMVTFNMSRSASYFESGTGRGMGFRDSCQDLLGFVHMAPERARERIIDIASIQWADGSTYHQYQPLTKRGNNDVGSGFNDDPLWLVACTYAYISETGDFSILEHPTPFDNVPGSEAPLMEHLRRSVCYTMNHKRTPRPSPDWQSRLERLPEPELLLGKNPARASRPPALRKALWRNLCSSAACSSSTENSMPRCAGMPVWTTRRRRWKQRRRKWKPLSRPLVGTETGLFVPMMLTAMLWGSHTCDEGQIFIEPQGMCVMADIGTDDGKAVRALDSVRQRLLGKYGVELLAPCYTVYHKELGEITSYPPGYKENGSVFCHNNPWISIAETVVGRGENALISTAEPALFIRRNTATFAGWNPMSMPRRWRPRFLR